MNKLLVCIIALLLSGFATVTFAQDVTARIDGQVTDPAGAVVTSATVTLVNTKTGEVRTVQSGDAGNYTLTQIQPGTYDLSVKAQGFKEYLSKGLEISVGDRKTINIPLETGAVSESVTVTAEAPLIQTSPTVGDVVENRRVVELPLNNRNFMQLLTLVPGVTSSGTSEIGIGLTNVVDFSINGTRRNSINFLVDGVSNTDIGSGITLLAVPTVDTIQEFRVITSVPTAEFGKSGGGVINLVTRGGGREFHGGVYEFFRNDKLNANSFFNNAQGRFGPNDQNVLSGLTKVGDERVPRPKLRYNNFGYLINGPVIIPGLYNQDREKTFFLFSQEWRRIIRAPSNVSPITVPSLLERQGNFSEAGNVAIFDPSNPGVQFTNNTIPDGRINQVAKNLLSLYPLPNVPAVNPARAPNRFAVTTPNIQNTRQETLRVDHNFNSMHRLTGRYTRDLSLTRELGGLFFGLTIPDVATTDTTVPGQVLAITLTSTFGPRIVNEATFTFSGNKIADTLVGRYNSDFAVPNAELFPENNSDLPAVIDVTSQPTIGSPQLVHVQYKNWNPKDNLTMIFGAHTFKTGFDISWESKDENAAGLTQGRYGFTGLQTRNPSASSGGIGLADFLLGRASSYSEPERDVTEALRFGRVELYGQDTWKIRPNLQLDFGLRYYRYRQPIDKNNVLATFLPELYNPAKAPVCANVSCSLFTTASFDVTNGFAYAGVNSPFGRRVQLNDTNDWAPRLGFAWDPWNTGKTVFRGGYGIYYDQALVGIVEQNSFTTPPFNNSIALTGTATAPIPFGNPVPSTPTTRGNLGGVNATTAPWVTPIIQQWALSWQQEVFRNALIEVGYAGSAGNHLIRPVDINAPTPAEIINASKGIAGCDTALSASNNPANCINLARPFRGFGAITDRQTSATSRYHGLLTSFRLRPTRGITAQLAYTFSKTITDATNDRDAIDVPQIRTNLHLERAVSRLDRPHVFVASYVYEVPMFKSGFAASGVGKMLLSGWEIAGITTAQSGLALNRVVQLSTTVPARGTRPDIVSDPLANIPVNPNGGIPYAFNPFAFRTTLSGQIGNSPRSPFRFPSQFFTDVNFTKNFHFSERYKLQFRAEFFNIFNKTLFNDVSQTIPDRLPSDPAFNNIQNLLATGSAFGQFFSTRDPRQVQLGLKFNF
ncbi:MAG TPA: carboxypeptidase regulatory-like domain-containing protein [Pyrinomonadaceae bacterium]|nr:carboxypeptidase regulatory-like domain-containing protein [Pyrinomonadaceae bacterium]